MVAMAACKLEGGGGGGGYREGSEGLIGTREILTVKAIMTAERVFLMTGKQSNLLQIRVNFEA